MKIAIPRGLVLATLLCPLAAAQAESGGVIHFTGAIVEEPCTASPGSRGVSLDCYRNGAVKTTHASFDQLASDPADHQSIARMSMHYLNPEKSLAIVQVDYK